MKKSTALLIALVCAVTTMVSAPLWADTADYFDLAHNGWTYTQEGLQSERYTHDLGFSYFQDAEYNDVLYQNSWWYRTAGDTREYGFSNLKSVEIIDNVAHLVYEELGTDGAGDALFRFELTYTLMGLNATQAYLKTDWQLTNLTSGALPVDLFAYVDFDINFFSDDDLATLEAFGPDSGYIKAWDDGGQQFNMIASGAGLSAWEIATWPATQSILTDDLISNLSSSGSPTGPDELAGAFQYTLSLDAGQGATGSMYQGVNVLPPSTVPEPGSLAGLVIGIAGLTGYRRIKR